MRTWAPLVESDAAEPEDLATNAAIKRFLTAARTTLGMDVAFVTALHDGSQTFVHLDGASESFGWRPGTVGAAKDGYCQYVLAGALPNIIADAANHPVTGRMPATHSAKIGAYVGVPLTLSNGRVYGALCVTSHDRRDGLGPSDLAFLRFLSELVAEQLAEQEHRLASRTLRREQLATFLEPGTINVLVQPIVDLASGRPRGVEALSRFPGAAGSPADVFAAASEVGMGIALELAAIRGALELLPQLPEHVYLSVNASPDTVIDPGLRALLAQVDGRQIVLELTEHVAFTQQAALHEALTEVRAGGARIAVDDTGAGYASLQNILSLAPEVIKLDLGLVSGIDGDPVRRALARALAWFADECGAAMVAEGIETVGELQTLRNKGVTFGQGYYLARPAALHDLDLDSSYLEGS